MAKLAEDTRKKIFERARAMGITYGELAPELKIHLNTLSRAMNGKSVNRNTADRLAAFAKGTAVASETTIELSPFAADWLGSLARETGVSTGEWCNAFTSWMQGQALPMQVFIRDSVANVIRQHSVPAMRLKGKGVSPSSTSAGTSSGLEGGNPKHVSNTH